MRSANKRIALLYGALASAYYAPPALFVRSAIQLIVSRYHTLANVCNALKTFFPCATNIAISERAARYLSARMVLVTTAPRSRLHAGLPILKRPPDEVKENSPTKPQRKLPATKCGRKLQIGWEDAMKFMCSVSERIASLVGALTSAYHALQTLFVHQANKQIAPLYGMFSSACDVASTLTTRCAAMLTWLSRGLHQLPNDTGRCKSEDKKQANSYAPLTTALNFSMLY